MPGSAIVAYPGGVGAKVLVDLSVVIGTKLCFVFNARRAGRSLKRNLRMSSYAPGIRLRLILMTFSLGFPLLLVARVLTT